jgi:hypothetical protein
LPLVFFKKDFHTIIFFQFHPSTLSLSKMKLFFFFTFYEDGLASRPRSWIYQTNLNWLGAFTSFYFYVKFHPHSFNCFFYPFLKFIFFFEFHPSRLLRIGFVNLFNVMIPVSWLVSHIWNANSGWHQSYFYYLFLHWLYCLILVVNIGVIKYWVFFFSI